MSSRLLRSCVFFGVLIYALAWTVFEGAETFGWGRIAQSVGIAVVFALLTTWWERRRSSKGGQT